MRALTATGLTAQLHDTRASLDITATLTRPGGRKIAVIMRGPRLSGVVRGLLLDANGQLCGCKSPLSSDGPCGHIRGTTYGEDASQTRTGNGPQVMATLLID